MFDSTNFDNFIHIINHNYHPKPSLKKVPTSPFPHFPLPFSEIFHHRLIVFSQISYKWIIDFTFCWCLAFFTQHTVSEIYSCSSSL